MTISKNTLKIITVIAAGITIHVQNGWASDNYFDDNKISSLRIQSSLTSFAPNNQSGLNRLYDFNSNLNIMKTTSPSLINEINSTQTDIQKSIDLRELDKQVQNSGSGLFKKEGGY